MKKSDGDGDSTNTQHIELNFALGDFTDSSIALAEEAIKGELNVLDLSNENSFEEDTDSIDNCNE